MDIAKIIREGREKLNLNQSQLADLIGVSPQAVQQWEAGATQPRGKRLNRIAEILKLSPTVTHFGSSSEIPAFSREKAHGERRSTKAGSSAKTDSEKSRSDHDPLINQVIEAMRHMSKEDAARLVTISKALVGEGSVERSEAMLDLKPLPAPDLAAHPSPAFPTRRMSPAGTKGRGKTAVR
ncbi:MAG: helix-turn-helix domain-containing protein [Nitrosospira sp.]